MDSLTIRSPGTDSSVPVKGPAQTGGDLGLVGVKTGKVLSTKAIILISVAVLIVVGLAVGLGVGLGLRKDAGPILKDAGPIPVVSGPVAQKVLVPFTFKSPVTDAQLAGGLALAIRCDLAKLGNVDLAATILAALLGTDKITVARALTAADPLNADTQCPTPSRLLGGRSLTMLDVSRDSLSEERRLVAANIGGVNGQLRVTANSLEELNNLVRSATNSINDAIADPTLFTALNDYAAQDGNFAGFDALPPQVQPVETVSPTTAASPSPPPDNTEGNTEGNTEDSTE